MHYRAKTRLVQTRVLTTCPLCGFRQRIDRPTGLEFQVQEPASDILPMEVSAVYVTKGQQGLTHALRPLRMTPQIRDEALYALAAKMLPIVLYLRATVPEFREALIDVVEVDRWREIAVQVDRPKTLVRVRDLERELAGANAQIEKLREILRWQKLEVEREVPWNQSWKPSGKPESGSKNALRPWKREMMLPREVPVMVAREIPPPNPPAKNRGRPGS